jgi:hypothetical protein
MSRTFYTERDIEDLARRGIQVLEVDDSVYITDLARERMDQLGIKRRAAPSHSPAAAPGGATSLGPPTPGGTLSDTEKQAVIDKVKSGVIARLGSGVDATMIDALVRRVVDQL